MANIPFDLISGLMQTVMTMGMNVKSNKERCQRVAKRVSSLQDLVLKLRERDPSQISEVVRKSLNELSATLVNARDMMRKFNNSNVVKSFIKNGGNEEKFNKINDRLDDTFQVLSGALQIEQGDILNKVLDAVSGKREATHTAAPFPIGFCPMPMPSLLPPPNPLPPFTATSPTMAMPTPTFIQPSPVPSTSPPPAVSPTSPTTPSVPPPKITITHPPNPPYPPAAPRPPMNPIHNTLTIPPMPMPTPCVMPPRVVTLAPPNVSVRPVMAVQNTFYGTLPLTTNVFTNPIVRTAPPVVITQVRPPNPLYVSVPGVPVLNTNPGVMTVFVNRPY